ncbi:TIGR03915 family putative DNA repair protein [Flavobacterium sp. P4023]|uniref:TIGR03915 family putative DNA repair protein n=1 Tax=Flavobacterium flabelliforme TaxID=2816119 RepID=A0ABS5CQP0_9FLAO|nr:TIGR03915 family putative DNA repair protein [Flavobacterium flabelliforme]MBP4140941.1 TIGR03915 family putative DNA repair protein [Flavobacterium flabelliforme]
MTILSYDSTFEGFLTAVFEIFEFKYQQPKIIKKGDSQQNIFATPIEIVTDVTKSDRVIKKLTDQLQNDGVRTLIYAFLSEKVGVEDLLFKVINYAVANKNQNVMKDFSNYAVLQVSQLTKSVGREKHRMEAFIRFELLKDGIYFAKIDPDFDVLTLIMNHFKNRYQDQKWLIYDLRRKYGVFYDLKNIEIVSLDLDLKLIDDKSSSVFSDSEIEYQKLWWEYFDHTNIKERKNTKLHLQHVPKRYWKYLTEKKIF